MAAPDMAQPADPAVVRERLAAGTGARAAFGFAAGRPPSSVAPDGGAGLAPFDAVTFALNDLFPFDVPASPEA